MSLGDKIKEELLTKKLFEIPVFGYRIPVSDTVVVTWIIMAVIIALSFVITRNLKAVPGKKQNIAEIVVTTVNNLVKSMDPHNYRVFAPYIGTVLLFLLFANLASLFNIIPGFTITPPTRNINVTAGMALMSMAAVIFFGIQVKGVKGYATGFLKPIAIILPFHILDFFIRPISLCFRLMGNILGSVIIMKMIYMVLPVGLPAGLSIYFDIFDGALQAYVFAFLTTIYISEAVEA